MVVIQRDPPSTALFPLVEQNAIKILEILAGSKGRPQKAPGIKLTVEKPLFPLAGGEILIDPIAD